MIQRLCLMASHGYPPGFISQPELGLLCGNLKGCQPLLPSPVAKPDILRYHPPCLKPSPCEEARKTQSECFDCNQFVKVDFSAQRPMVVDSQGNEATCSNAVLLGFSIVEQFTKRDKILKFLMSGTAEAGIDGANLSSLSDVMNLQLAGIDGPQQPLSSLVYPNGKLDIQKPLLYLVQDSALSSKITVHPDGQITFMDTVIEMKDLLSVVAESYLSKTLRKGGRHSMLVPHFSRVNLIEAESSIQSSTLEIRPTITAPSKSPEKVKLKPSKKNKKVSIERDLYKWNYLHAFETLLSLMVDKRQRQKTATLLLKKSGPELPELLTQFSVGIAGTGLAVLLSLICKLALGSIPFCASNLFSAGFGFGLVWLSWAVYQLKATIVSISKNAGKLGLKEKEMIQKLGKSTRDIYFSVVASLAMAMLRFS